MGTSACVTAAVSTAIACAGFCVAASADLCSRPRPTSTSTAATSDGGQHVVVCRYSKFVASLPLLPTAAERREQIHQRLEMRVLNLYERVLRAEESIFRVEHRQDVHRAGRHLRLREFVRPARLSDRALLPLLLLGGFPRGDQRVLDIAECGQNRLVVARRAIRYSAPCCRQAPRAAHRREKSAGSNRRRWRRCGWRD